MVSISCRMERLCCCSWRTIKALWRNCCFPEHAPSVSSCLVLLVGQHIISLFYITHTWTAKRLVTVLVIFENFCLDLAQKLWKFWYNLWWSGIDCKIKLGYRDKNHKTWLYLVIQTSRLSKQEKKKLPVTTSEKTRHFRWQPLRSFWHVIFFLEQDPNECFGLLHKRPEPPFLRICVLQRWF